MPEQQDNRPPSTVSRRAAITAVATVPLSTKLSIAVAAGVDDVSQLARRAAEKNAAFMRGDMHHWLNLAHIASDFTLMQPFGGPPSYGFQASPERLAELARLFQNGETSLEVSQTYASDTLIVLVMIERQQAEVGSLPRQDWSLRVTEVYRRDGDEWQLVHRHADPLVHRITLEQAGHLLAADPNENDRDRAHPSLVRVADLLVVTQDEAVTAGLGSSADLEGCCCLLLLMQINGGNWAVVSNLHWSCREFQDRETAAGLRGSCPWQRLDRTMPRDRSP